MKMLAASFVVCAAVAAPAVSAAQESVAVQCGPGQRAVVQQQRVNGRTRVIATCEGAQQRARVQTRSTANGAYRPVSTRGSAVQYVEVEREPERTKTKTALMIAGSAATGAGVGGALKGTKGAIIGAAVGGGAASIYEAAKRR
jgi:hypothetical protein